MKVGDYVRTPLGITKYLGKYNMVGNLDDWYVFDNLDENLWFGDIADVINKNQLNEVVIKSSPNIIDLIEVGDYVNGFPVLHKEKDKLVCGLLLSCEEQDIKSIVAKEQFESMEYKIER